MSRPQSPRLSQGCCRARPDVTFSTTARDSVIQRWGKAILLSFTCEVACSRRLRHTMLTPMRAFNVSLNGKKLCLAGVGERGVLVTNISWVAGDRGEDLFMHIGGLANEEHIDWVK